MRASALLSGLLAMLANVCVLAGESAVDQLKAYTESSASPGKTYPVPSGPPDVVGIALGMPLRSAFTLLQTKYPAQKLTTEATRLPGIDKPVLNQFSSGLAPVASATEWITVDVTPPPSPQVVWRVRRHLGRQQIDRRTLIESLRQKYGKESVELADNIADDQHATDLWWVLDDGWHVTNPPRVANVRTTLEDCGGWIGTLSWFAPNNIASSAPSVEKADWCNTGGTLVRARIGPEQIVTSLMIEMYSVPLAARAAKAELAWLAGIEKQQRDREARDARQNKPQL
jgi:hypothetical protein